MSDYYAKKLSSSLLKRCYDIAPPRVKQYLSAEMDYVLKQVSNSDCVLELGCGYGRVLKKLIPNSSGVIGIDTSRVSLDLAIEYTKNNSRCQLFQASAEVLPLADNSIDKLVCIQNGISAFKVDPQELILESVRVTKAGGVCLFSSYSPKFWEHRLNWFKMQADEGLIGEIDWDQTKDGVIFCKDGFKASTFRPEDFLKLTNQLDLEVTIREIDKSSIFCVIRV